VLETQVDPEMYMKTRERMTTCPRKKDDIYAWLHAILHRNAGILRESSPLLPLFERCGANPSFQNAETRAPAIPAERFESLPGNAVLRLE
jgi:hypothetical protein